MPTREAKRRAAGLYFMPYALAAMRAPKKQPGRKDRRKPITARQAILLALVDWHCNSYAKRRRDDGREETPSGPVSFTTKYLRRTLCANEATVRATIMGLARPRNRDRKLLEAQRLGRCRWRLFTRDRSTDETNQAAALYVPWPVRRLFEEGELTPMEMLVLAYVACFTRRGALCYSTNATLAKLLGVTTRRVQRIVSALVKAGWLRAEYPTKAELAAEVSGFRGRGPQRVRVLMAQIDGLRPDDDAEPDE